MSKLVSPSLNADKLYSIANLGDENIKLSNGYLLRPFAKYPEAKLRVRELTPELEDLITSGIVSYEIVDQILAPEVQVRAAPSKPGPPKSDALTAFQQKKVKLIESVGDGLRLPYL